MVLLLAVAACGGDEAARSAESTEEEARAGYLSGSGDARLHYRVLGGGPDTVVVVHGGPGAGMNSVLPPFAPLADRFALIFYDQRGGGRSELPADTTLLHARHFVEDLDAVRRHFGLERMNLLAHSFGSVLAARYAQKYPDRIDRIVLHGATGPRRDRAARMARSSPPTPDTALANRAAGLLRELLRGTAREPVETCREWESIGRRLAEARGERVTWNGTTCAAPPEAVRYYFRHTAQFAPKTFGDWDFTTGLEHVRAPLLVIHGGGDSLALSAQRSWASAVPNGRLLRVPGARKSEMTDRPDLVIAAITTFLNGEWPERATPGVPDAAARGPADPARRMAITVDDLPATRSQALPVARQEALTRGLVGTLTRHGVPAVGFVNESKLEADGRVDPARVALLERWLDAGLELGNHGHSHLDLHRVEPARWLEDVLRGERVLRPLVEARGKEVRWFRHPYLHAGRSGAVQRKVTAFLARHGYRAAPVTIDNGEWIYAREYAEASGLGDEAAARRLGEDYIRYMLAVVAFYEGQARAVLGRPLPHVLLIHANALNADWLGVLLERLESRGYRWVSLERALEDPAYGRSIDGYTGPGGISWLHRWAITEGVDRSVFRGEPRVPAWVEEGEWHGSRPGAGPAASSRPDHGSAPR